jgi:hypothetical protein
MKRKLLTENANRPTTHFAKVFCEHGGACSFSHDSLKTKRQNQSDHVSSTNLSFIEWVVALQQRFCPVTSYNAHWRSISSFVDFVVDGQDHFTHEMVTPYFKRYTKVSSSTLISSVQERKEVDRQYKFPGAIVHLSADGLYSSSSCLSIQNIICFLASYMGPPRSCALLVLSFRVVSPILVRDLVAALGSSAGICYAGRYDGQGELGFFIAVAVLRSRAFLKQEVSTSENLQFVLPSSRRQFITVRHDWDLYMRVRQMLGIAIPRSFSFIFTASFSSLPFACVYRMFIRVCALILSFYS